MPEIKNPISLADYVARAKQLYIDTANLDLSNDDVFAIADAWSSLIEILGISDDIETVQ